MVVERQGRAVRFHPTLLELAGTLHVELRAPGFRVAQREVSATSGQDLALDMAMTPEAPSPTVTPLAVVATSRPAAPRSSSAARYAGYALLGVGGAAAVTGGQSALLLAERGAAAVLSIEPPGTDLEPAREAGHHPFVQFKDIRLEELRPGTFDLVLAWDGARFAEEPSEVPRYAKLLAKGGRLVTALPADGPALGGAAGDPAVAPVPFEASGGWR